MAEVIAGFALASAGDFVVAGAFAVSASIKLQDLTGATIDVLDYRLVPPPFAAATARALIVTLIAAAIGLVLALPGARLLSFVVLFVLTIASGVAIIRGLKIDCHCGPGDEPVGASTLLRNAALAACLVPGALGLRDAHTADPMLGLVLASVLLASAIAATSLTHMTFRRRV